MNLFFHYSYSFADALTPELIRRIINKPIDTINGYVVDKRVLSKNCLLALGSILHFATNQDVIWGSGINPYWQNRVKKTTKYDLDIRAVRGPLTREYIISEFKIECPSIYGDPAMLFPFFFPEFKRYPVKDYLVIAQHNDEEYIRDNWEKFKSHHIFLCQRPDRLPWRKVVSEVLKSKFVISSSLHALILAESYGIPARWWYSEELPSSITEGRFKYNDYYRSTGRSMDDFASSIEEALEMGGKEYVQTSDLKSLIKSFPFEKFSNQISSKIRQISQLQKYIISEEMIQIMNIKNQLTKKIIK